MLKVFDKHIREKFREELVHDKEYQEFPNSQYNFWDMKDFKNPKTKIEIALHQIWKDLINPDQFVDGGIEYWINKSNGHTANRWHLDVIEAEQQNQYNSAYLTVAYYPYIDCKGGYLEIIDNQRSNSKKEFNNIIRLLDESTQVERIKPITGRAVFYDSYRIHRVARVYSGIRECLASSVWTKKPLTFNNKSSYNYK